ncbi:hypothetical protein GCM10018980_51710 [Streptomyces capoamus]|uniref:Uncharacterized protein n=1 Tax=Streptomyces capoamus TaxID=68183 RepID=A0A919EZE2_9ACTN|nr:hypothetical protein [Streptomyces capoamus]GGW15765.1 hypothetical protein GCM10010501_29100 [Streptomyces libani subsp. rufus]GHG62077.1 hypothetical protein GCM10018980_51710 [Streptomyces capoamus]
MAQPVPTEAVNAIDRLMNAADAFVAALQHAADQDTDHRGYWAGFVAQIKHVTEHGAAALQAPEALFLGAPEGSADRDRLLFLLQAEEALQPAAEAVFEASRAIGWDDATAARRGAQLAEHRNAR